jgi:hypothetical protein
MQTVLVMIYLLVIVLANISTAVFGPTWSIVNAFLFIGFSLTTRDALHDAWNHKNLWIKMTCLVLAGSGLSWVIYRSSGMIAIASMVAFGVSGIVDAVVYHLFLQRPRLVRMNVSNVFSSLADSLLFPLIAFGSLMPGITAGQFVAKLVGGFLWSLLIRNVMTLKESS